MGLHALEALETLPVVNGLVLLICVMPFLSLTDCLQMRLVPAVQWETDRILSPEILLCAISRSVIGTEW